MSNATVTQPSRSATTMDQDSKPTQALARRTDDAVVITSPTEYRDKLQLWNNQRYHVLSPFAHFGALPEGYSIVPAMVQLDPDPSPRGNGDVYQDNVFTRGEDVAISKIGLNKIAQAAGMSITTTRTDTRTIPNLWEVKATARWIGIDGTPQQVEATEEYDLRDGSPRTRGFTDKQLLAARAKGLRGCEARAINAAIRLYGVKQKYTKDELKKPFVIVRVTYTPDLSDAATRQIVTQHRMAGTSLLYGSTPALPAPAAEPEVLDTIGVGGPPIDVRAEPARQAPAAEPPARLVVKVDHDMEAGTYEVTLEGGEVLTAATEAVAQAAIAAKKAGQKVRVALDAQQLLAGVTPVTAAPTSGAVEVPEGAVFLDRVETFTGKTPGKDGKPDRVWTKFTLVAKNGDKWTTFDTAHATDAEEAITKGWPVRIADQANPKYPDQRDVVKLTLLDPRQGSLLPADGGY